MINSVKHDDCCGCEACIQACPARCIEMREDQEGFRFPHLDSERCLKCGKCLKVCPIANKTPKRSPGAVYAYRTTDVEMLKRTSSGGFFTLVAQKIVSEGGVVFGAAFNKPNEVVHKCVDSLADLDALRRSKYVQSRIGDSFAVCKRFLTEGRKVLFCGTPCQIKALRLYLGKEYENLTTIDFVCHGVPSPGVYRRYLEELATKNGHLLSELHDVNFRDKRLGYAYPYSFSFFFSSSFFVENPKENRFLKGFLADLYLRRSCHNCKSKGFSSGADYTMCDFWTVGKFLPDFVDKTVPGVNEVFVFNDKLGLFVNSSSQTYCKLDVCDSRLIQRWAVESVPLTRHRKLFFKKFISDDSVESAVVMASKTTHIERFWGRLRSYTEVVWRKVSARWQQCIMEKGNCRIRCLGAWLLVIFAINFGLRTI